MTKLSWLDTDRDVIDSAALFEAQQTMQAKIIFGNEDG